MDIEKRRDGKVLERLGSYDPHEKEHKDKIKMDTEKYQSWIAKGAQPTDTIVQILKYSPS